MLIYAKTFECIKTMNCNFPIEDQFYATNSLAVIADGITRDPVNTFDLSKITFDEALEKYPRPSGAELAAKLIVDSFKYFSGNLKKQLIYANKKVKELNNKYIKTCDYLQNDYYGAVAACVYIKDSILYWSYICDCGIIVYDKSGNIKFQTKDDKKIDSDPYINKIEISWSLPEARVIVRRDFRNNPKNIQDGKCVSYGALTGEDNAETFIREGNLKLDKKDIIVVYSDGFTNFLHEKDFIDLITKFDKNEFENYIDIKEKEDNKYASEKTIVVFTN